MKSLLRMASTVGIGVDKLKFKLEIERLLDIPAPVESVHLSKPYHTRFAFGS
jgi:hypothetical protein